MAIFAQWLLACKLLNNSISNQTMLKKSHFLLLSLTVLLGLSSCFSTSSDDKKSATQFRTFDIYDQSLKNLMAKVAELYDLKLDFDMEENGTLYSLSAQNATIADILLKVGTETGFYLKVDEKELIVQEEPFAENMSLVMVTLNENFWLDLHLKDSEIAFSADTVANFFGPLLKDVAIIQANPKTSEVTLYGLEAKISYIQNSLTLLNYSTQNRNHSLTLWVIEAQYKNELLEGKLTAEHTEFSWQLNAGDHLKIKSAKGIPCQITTTVNENNSAASTQLEFSYGDMNTAQQINLKNTEWQTFELSEKFLLMVKSDLYVNGKKLITKNLNSNSLKSNKSVNETLPQKSVSFSPGSIKLTDLAKKLQARIVSFTKGGASDISKFSLKVETNSLTPDQIQQLLSENKFHVLKDKNGMLIDCQGNINQDKRPDWQILPQAIDSSYYTFNNGAFLINHKKYPPGSNYLPSAKAILAPANSGILLNE